MLMDDVEQLWELLSAMCVGVEAARIPKRIRTICSWWMEQHPHHHRSIVCRVGAEYAHLALAAAHAQRRKAA